MTLVLKNYTRKNKHFTVQTRKKILYISCMLLNKTVEKSQGTVIG
jgi:hypothetical protein